MFEEKETVESDFLLKVVAKVKKISNNQARKMIKHGHVLVNEEKVTDPLFFSSPGEIIKIGEFCLVEIR